MTNQSVSSLRKYRWLLNLSYHDCDRVVNIDLRSCAPDMYRLIETTKLEHTVCFNPFLLKKSLRDGPYLIFGGGGCWDFFEKK